MSKHQRLSTGETISHQIDIAVSCEQSLRSDRHINVLVTLFLLGYDLSGQGKQEVMLGYSDSVKDAGQHGISVGSIYGGKKHTG